MSQIKDPSLASQGETRIQWVMRYMPLLAALEREFLQTKPLAGKKVAVSVHLEAKTARLCRFLQAGGATLAVTGSNPLSTRDDIAAALVASGIEVFAAYGATPQEYEDHLKQTLAFGPDLIVDDGGDFLSLLQGELSHLADNVIGGCEETTTGVLRMRARDRDGSLAFPMLAVNDAACKHLFDNRFGTGQSVWDAIMRSCNLVIAGQCVVVGGFGHCGLGVAEKARGLGARVIVTETDPVRALEAHMQGYMVMPMADAAPLGDLFVTVTGDCEVIGVQHMEAMKDGAILANAGHFDVEIDVAGLRAMAVSHAPLRNNIESYVLPNGKTLCLLAEGRLVNVGAGDGHPAQIMDLSFALQALGLLYLLENRDALGKHVYDLPRALDDRVARMALEANGVRIDALTPKQAAYLGHA